MSEPRAWTAHTVHVIEPTLSSESGHCLSLVRSLCESSAALPFELWVGKGARLPSLERLGAGVHSYFFRRLRKLQLLPLYRKLLREPGRVLVTTAGRVDLMMLDLAAAGGIAPGKVYLYFHWVRLTRSKQAYFRRMAQKHPNLVILGTTPTVEKVFRDCGFIQTLVVPYPATMDQAVAPQGQTAFRHVLFAGAARADKGFGKVVDLVAWLAQHGESIGQPLCDHRRQYLHIICGGDIHSIFALQLLLEEALALFAARIPNTRQAASIFPPILSAPCMPVAASPQANTPGMVVIALVSMRNPPLEH